MELVFVCVSRGESFPELMLNYFQLDHKEQSSVIL